MGLGAVGAAAAVLLSQHIELAVSAEGKMTAPGLVVANVAADEAKHIAAGHEAEVSCSADAPGGRHPGRLRGRVVSVEAATTDRGPSATFNVTIDLEAGREGGVVVGSPCEVRIIVRRLTFGRMLLAKFKPTGRSR
jgi:hypothetical protein